MRMDRLTTGRCMARSEFMAVLEARAAITDMVTGMAAADGMAADGMAGTAARMAGMAGGTAADMAVSTAAAARGAMAAEWEGMGIEDRSEPIRESSACACGYAAFSLERLMTSPIAA